MFTSDDAGERRRRILLAAAFAVAGPGVDAASAEILASDPGGFALRLEQQVPASPAATFRALVEDVSSWWHPAHTYSGDALNLVIDARAGGCFCEALADGGSVQHMQVVYAEPGKLLRMHGGLGPLQSLGVAGSLTWQVSELPAGSQITLSYNVGGYLPDGLDAWAKPVESVLAEQLGRLARHLGQVTDGQGQDHPQGEPEEHGSGQTGAPREE